MSERLARAGAGPLAGLGAGQVGDHVFGKPCRNLGIGGGIPFMEMLGRRYPHAQFVVTGALGGGLERARARRMAEHPVRRTGDRSGRAPPRRARPRWRACLTRKGGEPAEGAGAGLQRSSAQGVGPRVFAGFG